MPFDSDRLRDVAREEQQFRSRMLLSMAIVIALSLVVLWRYSSLQLLNYEKFKTESDRNRIHTLPAAPKRGLIYDRNGEVLAQNQATYSLMLTRDRIHDLDKTLDDLQQLFDISQENVDKFLALVKQRKPYQSVPLLFKLNDDEISRFSVNRFRFPGVEIVAQLTRDYPGGEEFSHILGYVGRINAREQESILSDSERSKNYGATTHIGKLGIEGYYEDVLHGKVGTQHVESNAHGKILRVLESKTSEPGKDIVLTIDADLQRKAYALVKDQRASIVAIDIASGGVLSMVSTPSFDNNAFVKGISNKDYALLSESIDLPLFNRSLQGQYPPGSTIKQMVGLAGLHHDFISQYTTISDPGWYKLPNDDRLYRDWKRTGHGKHVDLYAAIAESCDVYFYDLAFNLGIDRIHPFMQLFGFGERTGIDSTSESSGLMPSRSWKKSTRSMPWFPGETLNVGIGQGYMLATPLQLANSTAILARRGKKAQPHLVSRASLEVSADDLVNDSASQPIGEALTSAASSGRSPLNLSQLSEEHWDQIHSAMRAVIHSEKGTARGIAEGIDYEMAGKTGTAQVIGIAQGEKYDAEAIAERQRDHALFVGFAPFDEPKIAVAVVVENGGSGAASAAPIGRKIFDWYMQQTPNSPQPLDTENALYAHVGISLLGGASAF